jgi:arylsulfatase A-like enzyme
LSKVFHSEATRQAVIPAYMGLIKQIDDQLGVLFAFMQDRGLMKNTMIVMSSDHGDYLGDHWLGEKDLFHDASSKTPLIVYDPRLQADATRGLARDELVEGIDLVPTFLSYFGGRALPHILEGHDLTPLLHSAKAPETWRRYAVSEYDYCGRLVPEELGIRQEDARLVMLRDERWKFIHAEGFRPMLFDLETDPDELVDLGVSDDAKHVAVRARMETALSAWARQHHARITVDGAHISRISGKEPPGCYIGFWDEQDFEDRLGVPFSDTAEAAVSKTVAPGLNRANQSKTWSGQ